MRIASVHGDHELYLTAWGRSEGKQRFINTIRRVGKLRSSNRLIFGHPSTLKVPPLAGEITITRFGWEFSQNGSHSTSDEALQQSANVLPNVIYVIPPIISKAWKSGTIFFP